MKKATQIKKVIRELRENMLNDYKAILVNYYKQYGGRIPQAEIRLLFLDTISKHIIEKTIECVNRKTRKGKVKFIEKTPQGEILAEEHNFGASDKSSFEDISNWQQELEEEAKEKDVFEDIR